MRIIHVTGYYPPHLGGMEYRTKDLSENFAKRGYSVQVITSDIGCRVGKLPSKKNLHIQYLRSFELAHTPIIPSLFLRLVLLPKDSIIHLHISQAYLAEITYLVCIIRGFPYVAHIHLDVKAMCSEPTPVPDIIRSVDVEDIGHFHVNDPNLYGPGMGDVDYGPIAKAIKSIGWDKWLSVEVFKYDPDPETIASESIKYLRKFWS